MTEKLNDTSQYIVLIDPVKFSSLPYLMFCSSCGELYWDRKNKEWGDKHYVHQFNDTIKKWLRNSGYRCLSPKHYREFIQDV